mmetsp:Transcript_93743/g.270096  ORF Transcript_93743/g.270096 Transcript_93743/m.270096 type:complete len:203 (-) Transcript_93743:563-1171(-)
MFLAGAASSPRAGAGRAAALPRSRQPAARRQPVRATSPTGAPMSRRATCPRFVGEARATPLPPEATAAPTGVSTSHRIAARLCAEAALKAQIGASGTLTPLTCPIGAGMCRLVAARALAAAATEAQEAARPAPGVVVLLLLYQAATPPVGAGTSRKVSARSGVEGPLRKRRQRLPVTSPTGASGSRPGPSRRCAVARSRRKR